MKSFDFKEIVYFEKVLNDPNREKMQKGPKNKSVQMSGHIRLGRLNSIRVKNCRAGTKSSPSRCAGIKGTGQKGQENLGKECLHPIMPDRGGRSRT